MTRALATTLAAGAAVGLGMSGTASGQVIPWSNPAGGSWHVAGNWNGNEPDTTAETAQIALGGTYTVSLTASRAVAALLMPNPTATLEISNNVGLTLAAGTSTVDGLITINPTGGVNLTDLVLGNGAVLSGTGTVTMNAAGGALDRARVYGPIGGTWTHGAGHTIHGKGRFYYSFTNNGVLRADAPTEILDCVQGTITNNGTIQATGGGIFHINGDTINQTGGGQIQATGAGSAVNMSSATITGGTLTASGGGRIKSISATQTWNGPITVSGPLDINNNTVLNSNSGLSHTGTILVNAEGGVNVTGLAVAEGSTLGGTGTVTLNASGGALDRAELYSPNQKAWIHAAGHTVNGRGHIYYALTNNGLISADVPGEFIEIWQGTVANTGTLQSAGGGNLQFNGEVVNQTGGGTIAATGGGNVTLVSSTVSGGSLTSSGASKLISSSGNNTLASGLTVNGTFDINNNTAVLCTAGLNQSGVMTVNAQGGVNVTSLQVAAGTTLGGNGTVVLNAVGGALDRAYTASPTQVAWTHGAGHTIRGRGNMYYGMVNNGTITADMPSELIQMLNGTVTNNGTIQTAAGGIVQLQSETINQGAGGVIAANNGNVRMVSSTVSGGTMTSTGGNRLVSSSGTNTLAGGVVVNGTFDISNNTILLCPDGLTHTGALTVNSDGGVNVTSVQITAGTTLGGTGTLVLNAVGGSLDRAYMASPTQVAWTHGTGHTIRGRGNLYYGMTNNGTITADMPGELIQILNGTVTNNATMQTAGGGILQMQNETINQGSGGVIAANNGNVRLNASAISGGTMTSTGGSKIISSSGNNTLAGGVAVNGTFDINNNTNLLCPAGLTHSGTLTINADGGVNLTTMQLVTGGTIAGTGNLVLNAVGGSFDRAYLYAPAGTIINAHGHTISGTGNVYAKWTNSGTVHPSGPSRQILCQQGPFTQAADGTLAIEISGASAGSFDRLTGPQPKTLGGTLNVTLTAGFVPQACQTFAIITGPIAGTFSNVNLPPVPLGSLSLQYHANDVSVIYYPGDYNGDGFINGDDFDTFVLRFVDGDPSADFNNDGFVTGDDYDAFVSSFETGC